MNLIETAAGDGDGRFKRVIARALADRRGQLF